MSEHCLIEVRLKVDSLEKPTDTELDLLASVLPELILLMQQHDEVED